MTIWPNILSLVWVHLRKIIIGSSNTSIMIMVIFTIATPFRYGVWIISFWNFFFVIIFLSWYFFHLLCLLVLTFVCTWFGPLFTNCATIFATLKGRKWCWPFRFLFRDVVDVVTFFTMDKNKTSSNIMRIWH